MKSSEQKEIQRCYMKIIHRNFYRTHQQIDNKSTITQQRFYKFSKKRQKNLRLELNFTNEQNLNDFKNALT